MTASSGHLQVPAFRKQLSPRDARESSGEPVAANAPDRRMQSPCIRRAGAAGDPQPFLYLLSAKGSPADETLVRDCLEQAGVTPHPPLDWCCVRNFQDETRPRIIALPAGMGAGLCRDMERLACEVRCIPTQGPETFGAAVAPLFSHLRKRYRGFPRLLVYLEDVEEDILKQIAVLNTGHDAESPLGRPGCQPYRPTVLASGSGDGGPRIVFARDPNREDLLGCFPPEGMPGAHGCDPARVRGGLLHRANGGCLVVEASWIIRRIHLWELLKKAAIERELRVADTASRSGVFGSGVRVSEAIPLHVAVVVTGSPHEYALLSFLDPEFTALVGTPRNRLEAPHPGSPDGPSPEAGLSGQPPCHHSARQAMLRLLDTPRLTDERLGVLLKVIVKARVHAGRRALDSSHVALALSEACPERPPRREGPSSGMDQAHGRTARTTGNHHNHTEGKVSINGE